MSIAIYRNAQDVRITKEGEHLYLNVNDEKSLLHSRTVIARQVAATNIENVEHSLVGGHYVFENNKLREYKSNSYNGFIQSDEFIDRFGNDKTLASKVKQSIQIGNMGKGGNFDLTAGFTWSAFDPNLTTQVQVLRLICENGMTIRTSVLEKRVPIINLFDEHLRIASEQTIDVASRLLTSRLEKLHLQVASVRHVNLIKTHVSARLHDNPTSGKLMRIEQYLDHNMERYYTEHALSSGAISSHLPSHMNKFDLYNIVTEVSSHTEETDRSSTRALNKMASDLVLNENNDYLFNSIGMKNTFASPELAFFG